MLAPNVFFFYLIVIHKAKGVICSLFKSNCHAKNIHMIYNVFRIKKAKETHALKSFAETEPLVLFNLFSHSCAIQHSFVRFAFTHCQSFQIELEVIVLFMYSNRLRAFTNQVLLLTSFHFILLPVLRLTSSRKQIK